MPECITLSFIKCKYILQEIESGVNLRGKA